MRKDSPIVRCPKCSTFKARDEFHVDNSRPNGLKGTCKECANEAKRVWRSENKDVVARQNKEWAERNKERKKAAHKEWIARNEARARRTRDRWRSENPDRLSAAAARRRAAKLLRTPSWADHHAINVEYMLATWCSTVMREPYEVDHIVPLQGETVSGLHVHDNLRVIPARENMKKGNRVWPEMPE